MIREQVQAIEKQLRRGITDPLLQEHIDQGGRIHVESSYTVPRYNALGIVFTMNGKRHRDNGPAYLAFKGLVHIETHFQQGLEHREDGPSTIKWERDYKTRMFEVTEQHWKQNGVYYRADNLPTLLKNEDQIWLDERGCVHRTDGPAIIKKNGRQEWYQNNALHREADEPAIIQVNGKRKFYIEGKLYKTEDALASCNKVPGPTQSVVFRP